MFNTRLPLKEAVRAADYFQHSLAPHEFCLTGELWKASSELVPISLFPALLPLVSNATWDQAGLKKTWILVQWGDRKTLPQGDSGTSGHLCQIIYVEDREFTGPCGMRGKHRRAPSCLKSVPCHWLEISPLLQIYSYYWLCLQLPVTCSNVHNPSRVAHYIIHYLLLHLRENELFQLHSNEMATSAAAELQAGQLCYGCKRNEKSEAGCMATWRHQNDGFPALVNYLFIHSSNSY